MPFFFVLLSRNGGFVKLNKIRFLKLGDENVIKILSISYKPEPNVIFQNRCIIYVILSFTQIGVLAFLVFAAKQSFSVKEVYFSTNLLSLQRLRSIIDTIQ